MNVTISIDSFKGSLSTFAAAEAIREGVLSVCKDANVDIYPLADGGEGTVDAIVSATGGIYECVSVHNPLGEIIDARYGFIPKKKTAVIEMSAAAGITLIEQSQRNPMNTTTYGVGEMILDAIKKGCRKFIVGIGGSATNDGGVGMLQALGFEFLDINGNQVAFGAKGIGDIVKITDSGKLPELSECEFTVACDVKNPLCGNDGCSVVYGPQKGATAGMIANMDVWLSRYAELTKTIYPDANADFPGTGAAGGMGFAFLNYLGAYLKSGVDIVLEETGVLESIKKSDIVITGEGRLDGQSFMGKAPIGVAKLAKKFGKTVIAFSGSVTEDAVLCNEHGIDAFFPILRTPCTLDEAMNTDNAYNNLKATVQQVFRLISVEN